MMTHSVYGQIRHFIDLCDVDGATLRNLLNRAASLKADQQSGGTQPLLAGKTLAMIFEKRSTRTRVSFDLAMRQLGGYALELGTEQSQLSRGESVADTARVLTRYVDLIMFRARAHRALLDMAEASGVPVINGLTDHSHPCQVLADVLTFEEHRGPIAGRKVAWVGDGNNVAASWIHAAIRLGFKLHIACPDGYEPAAELLNWAKEEKDAGKGSVRRFKDPIKAVKGVDAVVTDTWVSMANDDEAEARHDALKSYQVTQELMAEAEQGAIFMHCLPAHRGHEVAADVIDGPKSAVWDEAENRLHVQKAILLHCLGAE